jgi:hypothetical protein
MFKIGDKVRAVEVDNMNRPLDKRRVYTVINVVLDRVELEDGKLYFSSRFVLVKAGDI